MINARPAFRALAVSPGYGRILAAVAAAVSLSLLAGSCTSSDVEPTAATEDATTVPASGQTGSSAGVASAGRLVDEFAVSWAAGDWDTLRRLSTDAVTETAQEWFFPGAQVEVVAPIGASGGELLVVDPQGGPGLIFSYGLSDADGSHVVTGLTFGGDAG